MTAFALRERPRILVVTLRRLGDVLFATPLIASLRRAWPQAAIDALVFEHTAGILAGNPDLDSVITMPARRSVPQGLALALRLLRRYDLAVSTQSGDRPTAFAAIAGRRSVGPVDDGLRGALRRLVLSRGVTRPAGLHRLEEMLRLADALGSLALPAWCVPAAPPPPPAFLSEKRKARLRTCRRPACVRARRIAPNATRWSMRRRCSSTNAGPRAAGATSLRRCAIADSPSWRPAAPMRPSAPSSTRYGPGLADVVRLDGRLSWPQLTNLLEGARAYVGPDTAVTHLAAASGCPTVALFGPTDPRLWGPVPAGGLDAMWQAAGTIQRRGNVWLVQNPQPCLPCHHEGCDRNLASRSRCLDELPAAQVMRAVDQALGRPRGGVAPVARVRDRAPGGEAKTSATGQTPVWIAARREAGLERRLSFSIPGWAG